MSFHIKSGFKWPCIFLRQTSLNFEIFFPRSRNDKIWPWHKIDHGHSRVIIYTYFNGPESPVPHAKFHDNQPSGYGEEDLLKNFTIYGHGSHLSHVTWAVWTNFCSRSPWRIYMKFNRPSGFRGEDVWKCWQTDNRQRQRSPLIL